MECWFNDFSAECVYCQHLTKAQLCSTPMKFYCTSMDMNALFKVAPSTDTTTTTTTPTSRTLNGSDNHIVSESLEQGCWTYGPWVRFRPIDHQLFFLVFYGCVIIWTILFNLLSRGLPKLTTHHTTLRGWTPTVRRM